MKSTGLSYVLWIFLGQLGIHKFYLGKNIMGIVYILLCVAGWVTLSFFVGWIFLIVLAVLLVVDLFTIPSQVRKANEQAAIDIANFNKKVNDNMNR